MAKIKIERQSWVEALVGLLLGSLWDDGLYTKPPKVGRKPPEGSNKHFQTYSFHLALHFFFFLRTY